MCKVNDFYPVNIKKVSGYLRLSFSYECEDCDPFCTYYTIEDSVTISDLSLGHGINEVYPGFLLDCDTNELILVGFSFDNSKYNTDLGGSLKLLKFSISSSSLFQ